ncbi:MAG TPA: hypothetical protein VGU69_08035 [Rhizomicrobium sp.]|nr:hypothetical protein [Rhizomicrobium sp.]
MNAMLKPVQGPITKVAEHPMPAVIAKLMALHAEAEDTARLVTLLQRTLYCAIALAVMAASAIAAFHHFRSATFSWVVLMLVAIGAVGRCYAMAYHAPFERSVLQSFEKDLGKVLLMSGTAWGMGAFLVVPAHAVASVVALFAIVPCLAQALLLRTRLPVLLFVAPVALLGSLACLILSGSAAGAVLTLLGCSAAAATTILTDRTGGEINFPLAGLTLTSRVFSAVTQR